MEVIPMAFPGERCRKASQVAGRARSWQGSAGSGQVSSEDRATWAGRARGQPEPRPCQFPRPGGTPSTAMGHAGARLAGGQWFLHPKQVMTMEHCPRCRDPGCKVIIGTKWKVTAQLSFTEPWLGFISKTAKRGLGCPQSPPPASSASETNGCNLTWVPGQPQTPVCYHAKGQSFGQHRSAQGSCVHHRVQYAAVPLPRVHEHEHGALL